MLVACALVAASAAILVQGSAGRSAASKTASRPIRQVPYVVGLPILKAALELQRDGFRVSVPQAFSYGTNSPPPSAGSQSLPSGTRAAAGTVVTLVPRPTCCVHLEQPPPRVDAMPLLTGRTGSEAIRTLIALGLPWRVRIQPVKGAAESILGAGKVVRQWPSIGAPYPRRTGGPVRPADVTLVYAGDTTR